MNANLPRFHCHRPPLSFPGCPLCKAPAAAKPPSTFFGKPGRKTRQPGWEEEEKGAHPVCDGAAPPKHHSSYMKVSIFFFFLLLLVTKHEMTILLCLNQGFAMYGSGATCGPLVILQWPFIAFGKNNWNHHVIYNHNHRKVASFNSFLFCSPASAAVEIQCLLFIKQSCMFNTNQTKHK